MDSDREAHLQVLGVSVFLEPSRWVHDLAGRKKNASRCVSFLPPDLDESFGGLSDFDLRWESWTFSVILMSSDLGSRECSESVLKIESGPLPAITSRHSELSSHSTPGHRMPSRA